MLKTFLEFTMDVDRSQIKKLRLISKLLKKDGLRVDEMFDNDKPYVFLYSSVPDTSFAGIRIYILGNLIGFRVAKQYDTEPYGESYNFALQDVYETMLDNNATLKMKLDPEVVGKQLVNSIGQQIRKFFKESKAAEEYMISGEILNREAQKNSRGTVVVQNRKGEIESQGPINMTATPNAYSNTLFSRN
jgi:hypothetical protein